jgi:hypothetical protein
MDGAVNASFNLDQYTIALDQAVVVQEISVLLRKRCTNFPHPSLSERAVGALHFVVT